MIETEDEKLRRLEAEQEADQWRRREKIADAWKQVRQQPDLAAELASVVQHIPTKGE